MPPAARVGDLTAHPGVVTGPGVATVLIGGMPAAQLGSVCAHGGAVVVGCPTVLIG